MHAVYNEKTNSIALFTYGYNTRNYTETSFCLLKKKSLLLIRPI